MSARIEIKKMMRKRIEASGNKVHNRFANHVLNRPRLLHWQLHILVRVSHVRQLPISGRVQKKRGSLPLLIPSSGLGEPTRKISNAASPRQDDIQ